MAGSTGDYEVRRSMMMIVHALKHLGYMVKSLIFMVPQWIAHSTAKPMVPVQSQQIDHCHCYMYNQVNQDLWCHGWHIGQKQ